MPSLDPALEQSILAVLRNHQEILLAILFGSVASNRQSAHSDLDIAIDAGHTLVAAEKIALISELAETTGRPVDLVDLRMAGEPLLGQVLKYGVRLVGSTTLHGNLIRKHLFDSADFMPYRERILRERRQAWIGN